MARQKQNRPKGKVDRKGKKKPGFAMRSLALIGDVITRHPSVAGGGAAFAVILSFVGANALWYQPGAHPAPFLSTRADFEPRPQPSTETAAPIRQILEQGSSDGAPEAVSSETRQAQGERTIEDILTPVPATRVQTVTIRESDDTRTASIPVPSTSAAVSSSTSAQIPDRELVAALQRELARLGLYGGDVDGLTGPMTEAALAAYAERTQLDGAPEPSERLLERLKAADFAGAAPATETRPSPASRQEGNVIPASLRPSDDRIGLPRSYVPPADIPNVTEPAAEPSDLVRDIQQGLVNIAYSDVTVDGVAGPETKAAIRDFQSHYRLSETGEPSAAVLEKLQEIGAI